TVIEPGKLISGERSNGPVSHVRWKAELPAKQLARSIGKEQEGRKVAQPIEMPGISVCGFSHGNSLLSKSEYSDLRRSLNITGVIKEPTCARLHPISTCRKFRSSAPGAFCTAGNSRSGTAASAICRITSAREPFRLKIGLQSERG